MQAPGAKSACSRDTGRLTAGTSVPTSRAPPGQRCLRTLRSSYPRPRSQTTTLARRGAVQRQRFSKGKVWTQRWVEGGLGASGRARRRRRLQPSSQTLPRRASCPLRSQAQATTLTAAPTLETRVRAARATMTTMAPPGHLMRTPCPSLAGTLVTSPDARRERITATSRR